MKIVIFSDSHGDVDIMCGVVENEKPDMIIHLGDSIKDAEQLNKQYPSIEMIKVLGNIDSQREDEEWIKYADICGKRFMLTHGHTFLDKTPSLEQGRGNMFRYPDNTDIILYGYTHEPYVNCCSKKEDDDWVSRWIMNPGRVGRKVNYSGALKPTYGILEISESGNMKWHFAQVE